MGRISFYLALLFLFATITNNSVTAKADLSDEQVRRLAEARERIFKPKQETGSGFSEKEKETLRKKWSLHSGGGSGNPSLQQWDNYGTTGMKRDAINKENKVDELSKLEESGGHANFMKGIGYEVDGKHLKVRAEAAAGITNFGVEAFKEKEEEKIIPGKRYQGAISAQIPVGKNGQIIQSATITQDSQKTSRTVDSDFKVAFEQLLKDTQMIRIQYQRGYNYSATIDDKNRETGQLSEKEKIFQIEYVYNFGVRKKEILRDARKKTPWVAIVQLTEGLENGKYYGYETEAQLALLESYLRYVKDLKYKRVPSKYLAAQMDFNNMNWGRFLGESIDPRKIRSCRSDLAILARQKAVECFKKLGKKFPSLNQSFDMDGMKAEIDMSWDLRDVNDRCKLNVSKNQSTSSAQR